MLHRGTQRLVGVAVVALAGAALTLQAAGLLRLAFVLWPSPTSRGTTSPGWIDRSSSNPLPHSECAPREWPAERTVPPIPTPVKAGPTHERALPPCDFGRVVLLAVSDDPDESLAGFRTAGRDTQLLRTGERLAGHRVVQLGWDRAWLAQGDQRCVMQLGATPPPPPEGSTGPRSSPNGRSTSLPPHLARLIERRGQHEVAVDRRLVEAVLEDPRGLLGGALARPSRGGAGPQGLDLRRIRPGSLLHALGLRTGDRLVAINGMPLDDPERLLQAYGALRVADHWSIALRRGGKPLTLDVDAH